MDELVCFKAYDIRGEVGVSLTSEIAFRIGRAYGEWLSPQRVVVGCDARLSSPRLKRALCCGLMESGAEVIDIGMCGTEEVYFATRHLAADGGIQITASHNPAKYNGMKLVQEDARPVHSDNGLQRIKALVQENAFPPSERVGNYLQHDTRPDWVAHLLSYLKTPPARPLRIVVNAGNGAAGPALDALEQGLRSRGVQVEFLRLNHQPDGTFPSGVPNPMLVQNRAVTQEAVLCHQADFGVAWDGDFDRCFFFDERGEFIESYYLVGLFAELFLQTFSGSTILLDPRLTWNTLETVNRHRGKAIISRTGHAFIKARMREENAIYGGEMSGHHYFRDFGYCDSGMIPLLLMMQILGQAPRPLSALVKHAQARYPVSGEINLTVISPEATLRAIADHYASQGGSRSDIDGLSIDFPHWRFNLRASNTEPLLRVNLETRASTGLLAEKTDELLRLIALYQPTEGTQ